MIIYRNNTNILTVNPSSNSQLDDGIMADHKISLSWSQSFYTQLEIGDYIEIWGERYKLNQLPTVKKISSTSFNYDCEFQSSSYDLAKAAYLLFDNTSSLPQAEFPLTGNALTFIMLLVDNLNRVAGSTQWWVGDVIDSVYLTLEISNESCMDVLSRLATEFDTEYRISGNTIHFVKVTRESSLILEYGSTMYDLERINTNNSDLITRLYAYGAERNIASDYRGGATRLMLPSSQYIESNTDIYGIIEATKTFDDIYPRLAAGIDGQTAGQITAIDPDNILKFTDANLDFNVNEQLIAGTPAKVAFLDGALGGYEFEIKLFVNSSKTFTLIENTDEKDFSLPNASLIPAVVDKYVLLYINMPQAYVDRAEAELYAAASEYLNKNKSPQTTYRCTFSDIYAAINTPDIRVGDLVTIHDSQLGINETIRVIKLTRNICDTYKYTVDLANTVTASTLSRITSDVKSTASENITQRRDIRQTYLAAYRNLTELQTTIFDTDGYFDTANIRPLSITTSMLTVGVKSQQFQLTCTFQPNADADPAKFRWSAGSLFHFSMADEVVTWNIPSGVITGLTSTDYPGYIYAKCSKTTNAGEIVLTPEKIMLEDVAGYYHFLLGILHTPVNGVCGISLTYGQTTINGQFIRTGVISSIDGAIYFDLNNGQIVAGPNRLNADGSISFGNGNFTISTSGDCTVKGIITALEGKIGDFSIIGGNLSGIDNGVKKIDLTLNNITPLTDLLAQTPEQTNYVYSILKTVNFSADQTGVINYTAQGTTGKLALAVGMIVAITFPAISNTTSNISANTPTYQFLITNDSGYSHTVSGGSGNTVSYTSDTAGIMDVKLMITGTVLKTNDALSASIQFTTGNYGYITTDIAIGRTTIGKNGFFSFWNNSVYFYFSQLLGGLKMRGKLDAPCVPAASFIIMGDNATTAIKNARISISAAKTSTGIYVVTHNIGHTNYIINATAMSTNDIVIRVDENGFSATQFRLICYDTNNHNLQNPTALMVNVTEIV